MSLLDVTDLRAGFGSNMVLHGVNLSVQEGTIVGIFGLNGAGKSVTLKVLAGIVPARGGTIAFAGTDVTRVAAEKRVAMGMGHVPQGRQVFPALTIEENLRLGAYTLRRRDRGRYAGALAGVFERFPMLAQRRGELAGNLSGGQQASLSVARALINEPKLILIDEPTAGLSPIAVAELEETLQAVVATGVTMLLVEQNVGAGLRLVERVNIMQNGRVVHEAAVGDLDRDELARYLGIGRMLHATTSAALKARSSGVVEETAKRAPAKRAAVKRAAVKRASAKRAPAKRASAKGAAVRHDQGKQDPTKGVAAKKAGTVKPAAKRASAKKAPTRATKPAVGRTRVQAAKKIAKKAPAAKRRAS